MEGMCSHMEGRDGVEASHGASEQIGPEDEWVEAGLDDGKTADGRSGDDDPCPCWREVARCDREEGLVHRVDLDVVDLVDAHNEEVAQQEREHAEQGSREEGGHSREGYRVLDQRAAHPGEAGEQGASDCVGSAEAVERVETV